MGLLEKRSPIYSPSSSEVSIPLPPPPSARMTGTCYHCQPQNTVSPFLRWLIAGMNVWTNQMMKPPLPGYISANRKVESSCSCQQRSPHTDMAPARASMPQLHHSSSLLLGPCLLNWSKRVVTPGMWTALRIWVRQNIPCMYIAKTQQGESSDLLLTKRVVFPSFLCHSPQYSRENGSYWLHAAPEPALPRGIKS